MFDAQNQIIGSFLREIDLEKYDKNCELIKKELDKAPDINDTILRQRFKKFTDDPIIFNNSKDNNDDDNNNKPNFPPGQPLLPHTLYDFQDLFDTPLQPTTFFQPPASTFDKSSFDQQQQKRPKNAFNRVGSGTNVPGERVMSEIERVGEKAKREEEVEQITPADP